MNLTCGAHMSDPPPSSISRLDLPLPPSVEPRARPLCVHVRHCHRRSLVPRARPHLHNTIASPDSAPTGRGRDRSARQPGVGTAHGEEGCDSVGEEDGQRERVDGGGQSFGGGSDGEAGTFSPQPNRPWTATGRCLGCRARVSGGDLKSIEGVRRISLCSTDSA